MNCVVRTTLILYHGIRFVRSVQFAQENYGHFELLLHLCYKKSALIIKVAPENTETIVFDTEAARVKGKQDRKSVV